MAEKTADTKKEKYFPGTGRRKSAVARVRLFKGKGVFSINGKTLGEYFQDKHSEVVAQQSLIEGVPEGGYDVSIIVRGGGKNAQAEAVRHGVARALLVIDEGLRPRLKTLGYLTRDPRTRERKKFGLKRARRARQWRKR